jgi:gamma-glutamyl phosphate reductase
MTMWRVIMSMWSVIMTMSMSIKSVFHQKVEGSMFYLNTCTEFSEKWKV